MTCNRIGFSLYDAAYARGVKADLVYDCSFLGAFATSHKSTISLVVSLFAPILMKDNPLCFQKD